jgi:transposase
MPKPIPIPIRRKLWDRAQAGEAPAAIAAAFGLSGRTVRNLLKRFRERDDASVSPDYRRPSPPHMKPKEVRQATLTKRREHPTWGAELIRVALAEERPEVAWPHPRTMRRWFCQEGLGAAPSGRRSGPSAARAIQSHQTWQIDASEHIGLGSGEQASWLRVVDEATGAVLGTAVFPPRILDSGRPTRNPVHVAAAIPEVGLAREAARRQRRAMGVAWRPPHRPGLLAGRTGGRCHGQPTVPTPG